MGVQLLARRHGLRERQRQAQALAHLAPIACEVRLKAVAVSFIAWLVGLGILVAIFDFGGVHNWLACLVLGLLIPNGFFLAALSWMENK